MNIISRIVLGVVFCGLFLSACIEELKVSEGGMSGTGVAMGRITAFGSIYVNGIHYDVNQAVLRRNGLAVSDLSEFNIGEFVTVTGTINAENDQGIAHSVYFSHAINGVVTTPASDNSGLEVMGQPVITDRLTVLYGFRHISDLRFHDLVEVSGFRNHDDTALIASSIRLVGEGESTLFSVSGRVQGLSATEQRFDLGSLRVDYSHAAFDGLNPEYLSNGLFVELESMSLPSAEGVLQASRVIFPEVFAPHLEGALVEVEGTLQAGGGRTRSAPDSAAGSPNLDGDGGPSIIGGDAPPFTPIEDGGEPPTGSDGVDGVPSIGGEGVEPPTGSDGVGGVPSIGGEGVEPPTGSDGVGGVPSIGGEGGVGSDDQQTLFWIGGQLVAITSYTEFLGVSPEELGLEGVVLEVEGGVNSLGILQASRIINRSAPEGEHFHTRGFIEAIDYEDLTITLLGQVFQVNASSLLLNERSDESRIPTSLLDGFSIGDFVSIDALREANDQLRVLRLDQGGRDP